MSASASHIQVEDDVHGFEWSERERESICLLDD